ncbi:hypothetical protein BGX26_008417 [Mortierella sp. AD094]|nr:hypothetical protein BGX26_008417 [Mortierella sp. AD094]
MASCPISLGCDPRHSYLDSCFSLPACRNAKEYFKDTRVPIPKLDFTGDPEQAPWISEFDHIESYAEVDRRQEKLMLRTRRSDIHSGNSDTLQRDTVMTQRDTVMTQSGGGFGATVSSTRWVHSVNFRGLSRNLVRAVDHGQRTSPRRVAVLLAV